VNPLLAELDGLCARGVELAGGPALATVDLQAWLGQRGKLFAEIDRTSAALTGTERTTLDSLIQQTLELDATIMAKAEAAMRRVGAEIAAVQKLKKFLAGGVKPASYSLLRRAL
jgi:hypothetical protein